MTVRTGVLVLLGAVGFAVPAHGQSYTHYECTDGAQFEVAFYPETKAAYVQVDGKSFMLPKRLSLTSQRFTQSGISLSLKSDGRATLKHYGKTSQCQAK
jgi:hypothetical protein